MANIRFRFSHRFDGTIWNTLADGANDRLFLEVRNPQKKTVSFSALNLRNNQWLWKDLMLEEAWWVSLRAVQGDILLFTVYTDRENPDKKSVIAHDVVKNSMVWWRNGFSLTEVASRHIRGVDSHFPGKEIFLDLFTGQPVHHIDFDLEDSQNFPVIRPFQYKEGTAHFNTVKDFLSTRVGISPVAVIEYLEFADLIIMSLFVREEGLANYLYIFDARGDFLTKEQLGANLEGVGLDTFYIFPGQLFFVKNKNELTSYEIL